MKTVTSASAASSSVSVAECLTERIGPSYPLPRVMLTGNWTGPEFAAARRRIHRDASVTEFASPAAALQWMTSKQPVELLMVAQEHPGQWGDSWLDRLRHNWPLTRSVAVVGTWCAGETRTGRPLGVDVRIPWHGFTHWWTQEMRRVHSGETPGWSFVRLSAVDMAGATVPLRKGRGEAVRGQESGAPRANPSFPIANRGLVIIAAVDRDTAEALTSVCQAGGWASVWVRPGQPVPLIRGASVLLYDAVQLEKTEVDELRQLSVEFDKIPIVAVADLPTFDRTLAARSVGVTSVLAKPFSVEDLLSELDEWRAGSSGHIELEAAQSA